jgi:hypothetical protein
MSMLSATPRHHYRLFGMTLASDLELPELAAAGNDQAPDLVITSAPPDEVEGRGDSGGHPTHIKGVAHYRVRDGRSIVVSPEPGAEARDVRLYLLGVAMATALHQRGSLPLHVSAVEVDGEIHAFCGASGAGKSTLVTALQRHGLKLFCDDVGVVELPESGGVRLFPGVPRVKLWRDALGQFGIDETPLQRDLTRADKFHLEIDVAPDSLPLRALYVLERREPDQAPTIEQLSRQATVALLIQNTYRPGLQRRVGAVQPHLQRCLKVASMIEGWRYARPWSLRDIDASLQPLLDHLGYTA